MYHSSLSSFVSCPYAFSCWTCLIFPHSEDSSCNAISLSKLRLQSTRNFLRFASRKYSGSASATQSHHSRLRRDGRPSNSFSAWQLVMSIHCKLGLLLILSRLGFSYDQSLTSEGKFSTETKCWIFVRSNSVNRHAWCASPAGRRCSLQLRISSKSRAGCWIDLQDLVKGPSPTSPNHALIGGTNHH